MLPILPGLLVAGCGVLLAGALRRCGEPLRWGVALALLALVLLLFHPVLFAGGVLLPADALLAVAPFAGSGLTAPAQHGNFLQHDLLALIAPSLARVRGDLAAGEWPLWNPLAGAGIGLLSDPQAQAGQPLVLLALLLPVPAAMGVAAALRVLLALLFTFLFLRRQGASEWPALAGAFAWGLSGYLLLWLGWPLANTGCWLPVLLWAAQRALLDGGRRDAALLGLAALGLALAGHPETVLYALGLGALLAAVQLRELTPVLRVARARRALAAVGLGLALALPVLLPGLLAAGESQRAAGLRSRVAAGDRAVASAAVPDAPPSSAARPSSAAPPSWRRWLPVVAPNAFGNSRFVHYWGPENSNEDASGFVGTTALLLALLGLLARGRRLPLEAPLQLAVAVSLLAMALPAPLRALADRLPLALQSTTYYHRLLLVVGFALSCLAALALERWLRGELAVGERSPGGPSWSLTLAVASGLAVLVAWAYLANPHPTDPQRLAVLRDGSLRWQLRFLVLAAIVLVLPALVRGRSRGAAPLTTGWLARVRRATPPLLAAAVAAELLIVHAPANPAAPAHLAFPASPTLERLASQAGAGARTLGVGRVLPANVPTVYGLADPRLYNPMQPAAYAPLASALAAARPAELLAREGAPVARLAALLGVGAILIGEEPGGRVEPLPDPLPLLWLPRATAAWDGGPSLAWALASPDPRELSHVEGARATGSTTPRASPAPGAGRHWRASEQSGLDLLLARDHRGARLTARLSPAPAEARLLASSVLQDGGWRVLADQRALPTTRANGPFVAAWLPAGTRRVELVYRPRGLLAGALLAALAAAAAAAWLAPPVAAARRHTAAAVSALLTAPRGERYIGPSSAIVSPR